MTCLSLFNSWITHSILLFPLSSRLLAQAWATTFKSSYTTDIGDGNDNDFIGACTAGLTVLFMAWRAVHSLPDRKWYLLSRLSNGSGELLPGG
jgi:hypothetical protein